MIDQTVGFAVCGSFCTHAKAMEALEQVKARFSTVIPIVSESTAATDTRFGPAHELMREVERICDRRVISSIREAEPIPMYVQSRGWQLEMLNLNETELGGVKEAIFSVDGAGAYNRLKYESGVHRVQRVPETETQGRIHTSTATVAVMPQAEEVDFALDMKDLRIDTFRSSGAGGQHINKTSSAIRVTHLPTGMVVECQNERSQFQNKDKALEILRSRLLAQKQKQQQDAINASRQGQVGTGDRSEKIRTYNFPQDRCTDHRIGLTVHNLSKIMDGNLDELIDALATREQAEKLQKLNEQG